MLGESEVLRYLDEHGVDAAGREYIQATRNAPPARGVGENAKQNLSGLYFVPTMGQGVPAESWTIERHFLLESAFDPTTLEIHSQPEPIRVVRTHKNGRRSGTYTPDYLVLSASGPIVVEVKSDKEVEQRINECHPDWMVVDSETRYAPAAEAFAKIGLTHVVSTVGKADRIRHANLSILVHAYTNGDQISDAIRCNLKKSFDANGCIYLLDLADELDLSDLTPLIQMIATGELACDINHDLLANPESTMTALSWEALEAWKIHNSSISADVHEPNDSDSSLSGWNHKAIEQAYRNLERVKSGDRSRHARRLRAQIEEAEKKGKSPLEALLGQYQRSGNRTPRLPTPVQSFLTQYIDIYWAHPRRLPLTQAYREYSVLARQEHPGQEPVSRATFRRHIDRADPVKIAKGRGGGRMQNAARPPSAVADRGLRGILPYLMAAIDHYLGDIFLVILKQDKTLYVKRPWITVCKDLCTGAILGRYISLYSPSRMACAMVLRDCVRRNGRLPQTIVVDRGKEFESVYFVSLLAHLGLDLVWRPSGNSRYGGEIERLFGEFARQWLPYSPGNTVERNEARAVSAKLHATNLSVKTPEEFIDEFDEYIEWSNHTLHGSRLSTPIDQEEKYSSLFSCVGKEQSLSKEFIVASSIDVRDYKVDPVRGIHTFTGWHYWAPGLKTLSPRNRKVPVRVDPESPYVVYAQIDNSWVDCIASPAIQFQAKKRSLQEAEAFRLYGGSAVRELARKDAQERIVEIQHTRPHTESPPEESHESVVHPEPAESETSIFARSRQASLLVPPVSTWDDEHG